MHYVYIIYSPSFDRYYIGESVNAVNRSEQHNSAFYGKASTSYAKDWELVLQLEVANRLEALQVERYIKSMKSKVFIWKLVSNEAFLLKFKEIIGKKFQIKVN